MATDEKMEQHAEATVPRIERRDDGQTWAHWNGAWQAVRVHTCFPWTRAGGYVSLRDDKDNEVTLIQDLDNLDAGSRAAVDTALAEAAFVLEIVGIESIEDEFEIRNWRVRTRQGARTFQTPQEDWPHALPDGTLVIKDVAGDLFCVSDIDSMDEKSKKMLWAFVD